MPVFLLGVWNFDSYDFGLCVSNQPAVKSLDFESPTNSSGQRHCTTCRKPVGRFLQIPCEVSSPGWSYCISLSITVVLQVPLANHWMCRWLCDLSVSFLASLNSKHCSQKWDLLMKSASLFLVRNICWQYPCFPETLLPGLWQECLTLPLLIPHSSSADIYWMPVCATARIQ